MSEKVKVREPWQVRVIQERNDEYGKCQRLERFMDSTDFANLPTEDRELLNEQLDTMTKYVRILGLRIERFT